MIGSLDNHLKWARRTASLLDAKFSLLGLRFGIDPLLNIIPGVGSGLGTLLSLYLFYVAYLAKVPGPVYIRMLWNMTVDYLAGIIPVLGIFFDVLYRANMRNLDLIEQYAGSGVIQGEIVE